MATMHARAADRPPAPKPAHTYSLVIFITGVALRHHAPLSAVERDEDYQSRLLRSMTAPVKRLLRLGGAIQRHLS
jgi:hypothetical protein